MDEFKSVKNAIPFRVTVRVGKNIYDGQVLGTRLAFPIVSFDNGRTVEISWDLAKRLYTKQTDFVIAD
jgi:hypothetical protein